MKLSKSLTIGATDYHLISETVVRVANGAGRAEFIVDADGEDIDPFQPVALDIGYTQHDHDVRFFLGYVESANPLDARRVSLFCRELTYALKAPMPIALRHPTFADVLAELGKITQLAFSVPEAAYATKKIAHFANVGNGFQALTAAGRAFEIEDFFWQQEPSGSVFAGSWQDSAWPEKAIDLPANMFNEVYGSAASLPVIPALAPGASVNGKRVTKVELQRISMSVTWV